MFCNDFRSLPARRAPPPAPAPVAAQPPMMAQPQQPSMFKQMAATAGGVAVGSAIVRNCYCDVISSANRVNF